MKSFVIVSLQVILVINLSGQPAEVGFNVIGNPREFSEISRAKEITIRESLEKEIPNKGRQFIVVARRWDCWVTEFESPTQRKQIILNAAITIKDAAQFPVFCGTAATVAEIKKKVSEELSSDVVFNVSYLTDASVGQKDDVDTQTTGTPLNVVTTKEEVEASEDNNSPLTPFRFFTWIFGLGSIVAVVAIAGKQYLKSKNVKEEKRQTMINSLEESVAKNEQHLKLHRFMFDEINSSLNCFIGLLLVGTLTFSLAVPVYAADPELNLLLDVSGTMVNSQAPVKAKEILAGEVLRGTHPALWFFGDSVRFAKRFRTLRELDSVFVALPKDQNTRLAEALSFLVQYTDSLRRKGLKPYALLVSDFNADDAANASLLYLPTLKHNEQNSLVNQDHQPEQQTDFLLDMSDSSVLLAITVILFAIILIWLFTRKKKPAEMFYTIVISNGHSAIEYKPREQKEKELLIADSVGADIRTFDSRRQVLKFEQLENSLKLTLREQNENVEPLTFLFSNGKEK